MKRWMKLLAAGLLVLSGLAGCGRKETAEKTDGLQVVVTIFPEYDWVRNILGDNPAGMEVTMLLESGADLHSYQPTADDIRRIADCDVFICVGGESDAWVDDALSEAVNRDMTVIRLMEELGDRARIEETVEGMEAEKEEGEEEEYDEHIWLSLRNAERCTEVIRDALAAKDAAHADVYRANADAYLSRLKELDGEYETAVSGAKRKVLLFGDRFPFRYLTDDYGLKYYAAFKGCSAETEASFETILFLSDKLKEEALPDVMIIEGGDGKIARTIIDTAGAADCGILTLDSMQSVTSERVKSGASYLDIMEHNLSVLKEALN